MNPPILMADVTKKEVEGDRRNKDIPNIKRSIKIFPFIYQLKDLFPAKGNDFDLWKIIHLS